MALITMEWVDSIVRNPLDSLSEWTMNIFRRNMTEMYVVAATTTTTTTVHWTQQINSATAFILGSKSARVPPKGDHNENSTFNNTNIIRTGNYTRQAQIFLIKYFEMQRLCCAVSCHFYGISFIDTYEKEWINKFHNQRCWVMMLVTANYLKIFFSSDMKICFNGIIDYRV